jgi:DNA (cytosine-5)-methyltransferase 1
MAIHQPTAYSIRAIGSNRGAPRIWLEGRLPASAGFAPHTHYRIQIQAENKRIILRLDPNGDRKVSQKEIGGNIAPVIDINSKALLSLFDGLDRIRVSAIKGGLCIEPIATDVRIAQRLERLRDKMATGQPLSVGSISHGGGVLSKAIHDGISSAGVASRLAFANEIRDELLAQASEHNPAWDSETVMLHAPLQELAFDHNFMATLPQSDILEAGLPCSGASLASRGKLGTECAEAHDEVGHLVVAFLAIVARVNPAVVLLENVPLWQHSASMWILRHQLRDLGYVVHERLVESADWNCLEDRTRLAMTAVTVGMEFDYANLIPPAAETVKVGSILESIALDDPSWSTMQYLKEKEVRDIEAGKGFRMHIVDADSTKVSTLGKGYTKNRSTETKVRHPENPELLRIFTPLEHAAIKGIDPALIAGLPKTTAHELLGQSIIPAPFIAIGKMIGETIASFCADVAEGVFVSIAQRVKQAREEQQAKKYDLVDSKPKSSAEQSAVEVNPDQFALF